MPLLGVTNTKVGSKIVTIFASRYQISGQNAQNSISAGAVPDTSLGSLQCSPRFPSWIEIERGLLLRGRGEDRKEYEGRENWKGIGCFSKYATLCTSLIMHGTTKYQSLNQ